MVLRRTWWPLEGTLLALTVVTFAEGGEMSNVMFFNFRNKPLDLNWDNQSPNGQNVGQVPAMGSESVGRTFEGHRFMLVEQGEGDHTVVATFEMKREQQVYMLPPLEEDREHPAYLNFLKAQEEASKKSIAEELDELHARGELRAVSLQSRAKPLRTRPAFGVFMNNFRQYPVGIYWDNGSPDGVYSGEISAMGRTGSLTTYPGDVFKLMRTMPDGKKKMVARFTMDLNVRNYVVKPEKSDTTAKSSPQWKRYVHEYKLDREYLNRTGLAWLGTHPPDPPSLPMYPPGSSVGEVVHTVNVRGLDKPRDLVALSWNPVGPRAYFIGDVLNSEECAHVLKLAENRLGESTIGQAKGKSGGIKSNTRTSKIAFIPAKETTMLQSMHEKFADILNVSDAQLSAAAEHLQVVRYELGQEYAPHYDYTREAGLDRLATLLVYLGDDGGTMFPRAFDDRGLVVRPKKGDAILFYSQLPDGNLDELSLHAGMPVASGTKWVCNVWMHSHDRSWRAHGKSEL